ncbi:hypothetical protein Hanom_Chr09g00806691 [Helianthus anomalus]
MGYANADKSKNTYMVLKIRTGQPFVDMDVQLSVLDEEEADVR